MFGLESGKGKKKAEGFIFDLEKELGDKKKQKEILDKLNGRVQQIKGLLRTGEDQALFQKLGALLYGYGALVKVMSRIKVK